jgi:hypothetical protein
MYVELSKIVELLPFPIVSSMFDIMAPKLFTLIKHSAEQIKQDASLLLSHLIYYLPNSDKKYRAIDHLKTEFA